MAMAEGTIDGWVRVHGHAYPLHPVTVRVYDAATGEAVPGLVTENNPDGTYQITGVPNGEYKVHYDAHGEVSRYLDELAGSVYCDAAACDIANTGSVIVVNDDTRTLNANLLEGAIFGGRVVDGSSRPLEGVTVEFFDEHGEPYCCGRLTDENGRWQRPMYFPASYYVLARYADPSPFRPRLWADDDCSGCDVTATGSPIDIPYFVNYNGINIRLIEVGPDPSIEIRDVAQQKYSGSWFNPERDGEGFIVEVLDREGPGGVGQEVVVFWFTYTPDGEQAWMVGTGTLNGRVAEVEFEITEGASFGSLFSAADVVRERWGALRLEFLNCNHGHAQYAGAFGSGQLDVTRLSAIEGLDCGDPAGEVISGNPALSGAWFNPARDGQGFILEFTGESNLLAYWFTYGADGGQMWLLGLGNVDEEGNASVNMLQASGGRFGDRFNAEDVSLQAWGDVSFQFGACDDASYNWTAPQPYGSGGFNITRLTVLKNSDC